MFDSVVIHLEDIPDIKFKLPDTSTLNWAVLYFKVIVFVVFKNGLLKVNVFCFVPNADELLIFCDAGGANSWRIYVFKFGQS